MPLGNSPPLGLLANGSGLRNARPSQQWANSQAAVDTLTDDWVHEVGTI